MTRTAYYRRTLRTNVLRYPAEWGDRAAVEAGAERVRRIVVATRVERVVVLGVRAAGALGLASLPLWEWTVVPEHWTAGAWIARAPHPSGRNRLWNDPDVVEVARGFWTGVLSAL